MKNVSLSIIVPVYNVQEYVSECLNSIIMQMDMDDELIIINDGSTDSSGDICKEFLNSSYNIIYILQENKGLGAARNRGIKEASKDYIIFVDSDDYLSKNALNIIRKTCSETNSDIVQYSASIKYDIEDSNEKANPYERKDLEMTAPMLGKEYFLFVYPRFYLTTAWSLAIKRKYMKNTKIQFIEGILHEDIAFTIENILEANSVIFIPNKLYVRRIRNGSIMISGLERERAIGIIEATEEIINYLRKNYNTITSNLRERVLEFIWNTVAVVLPRNQKLLIDRINKDDDKFIYFIEKWTENLKISSSYSFFYKTLQIKEKVFDLCALSDYRSIFIDWLDLSKIEKKISNYKKKKIDELPFSNSEMRVGIYGCGNHTKNLLDFYYMSIGDINSEIVFFETMVESEKSYMHQPVYDISKARDLVDIIIISSYKHQFDMDKTIDEKLGKDFRRISLYDAEDRMACF